MAKKRIPLWLALIVLIPGVIVVFVLGLWSYMSLTATPIHPDAQQVPAVSASSPAEKWSGAAEQARQIARASLAQQNLPGLSVAVGIDGGIVWAEGFGWADIDNRVKVDPRTRFPLGMASKVLTSAAAGMLIERGQLKLDDEIQTYVSAYPRKQWPVTVRQLMAHTAGLRTDGGDEGPRAEQCDETLDALRLFADQSLLFEPGTQYRYSNYGWILVSAAIESAGGEPFYRFMRRQVFDPLGMEDTRPDSIGESIANRATPYFPKFAGDPRYGPQEPFDPPINNSCFSGSGNFLTTPSDLVRFGLAINGGRVLQPSTVQMLQTSQRLTSGEETGYGLGWDLEPVTLAGQQTRSIGHDGEWMGGNVMSFMTFPERGLVIAVMANTAFADTFTIGTKIAEAFAQRAKGSAGETPSGRAASRQ